MEKEQARFTACSMTWGTGPLILGGGCQVLFLPWLPRQTDRTGGTSGITRDLLSKHFGSILWDLNHSIDTLLTFVIANFAYVDVFLPL